MKSNKSIKRRNPVAKYAGNFNNATVIDSVKTYKRKEKHRHGHANGDGGRSDQICRSSESPFLDDKGMGKALFG